MVRVSLPVLAAFLVLACMSCGDSASTPAAPSPLPISQPPTAVAVPTSTTQAIRTATPSPLTPVSTRTQPAPAPTLTPLPPDPTATPTQVRQSAPPAPTPSPDPTHTPVPTGSLQTAQTPPTPPDVIGFEPPGRIAAPAPAGLDGWINSQPLEVSDFAGKLILFDFWTYTCVNCVRTLPYLQDWHEKYADEGLQIIGIHTPEFDFEKLPENVAAAVADLGVGYAVAQDNDRGTWNAYRVQAWPTKYIVDGDGFVRYYYRGEGAYADTELVIRYLLEEMGRDLSHIDPNTDPDPVPIAGTRATDLEKFLTRELYAGTRRNIDFGGAYILNEEYYGAAGVVQEYTYPGEHRNNFLFLHGQWLSTPESLDYKGPAANYDSYIGFRFFANEVNVVLDHEAGESYDFRVEMDGDPVPEVSAGADIQYDDEGNSFVTVDSARMYRLVRQSDVTSHELLIRPADDLFSVYAFTFGAYGEDDG